MPKKLDHCFGISLGRSGEPSALALVERREDQLTALRLEQFPPGTKYLEIAERLFAVVKEVPRVPRPRPADGDYFGPEGTKVVLDVTGVGRRTAEVFKRKGSGALVRPLVVTGGFVEAHEGGCDFVPKTELVATLQTILQARRLKVSETGRGAEALAREMTTFRADLRRRSDEFDWRDEGGTAQDLVFALAAAAWRLTRRLPEFGWTALAIVFTVAAGA
jgi:hypothetical protein